MLTPKDTNYLSQIQQTQKRTRTLQEAPASEALQILLDQYGITEKQVTTIANARKEQERILQLHYNSYERNTPETRKKLDHATNLLQQHRAVEFICALTNDPIERAFLQYSHSREFPSFYDQELSPAQHTTLNNVTGQHSIEEEAVWEQAIPAQRRNDLIALWHNLRQRRIELGEVISLEPNTPKTITPTPPKKNPKDIVDSL